MMPTSVFQLKIPLLAKQYPLFACKDNILNMEKFEKQFSRLMLRQYNSISVSIISTKEG